MIHEKKFQSKLADYIKKKMQILWPSGSGNNPMTEANLLLCAMELLRDESYANFMEVPFYENGANSISGRYDGVAIKENTMLLIEAKSDKRSWAEEILNDFIRMENYKNGNIPFLKSENINRILAYSIYWTEEFKKASVFQEMKNGKFQKPFENIEKEGLFIESTEIEFNPNFSLWINLLGRQIL